MKNICFGWSRKGLYKPVRKFLSVDESDGRVIFTFKHTDTGESELCEIFHTTHEGSSVWTTLMDLSNPAVARSYKGIPMAIKVDDDSRTMALEMTCRKKLTSRMLTPSRRKFLRVLKNLPENRK